MQSRREFIGSLSLGSLGIVSLSTFKNKDLQLNRTAGIPEELTILFQGDSITDAGRNRAHYYPNYASGMGHGYVFQIVSELLGNHPDKKFSFYNRGISGNKVYQLASRWEDDCLKLKPDVLSILIGVNDFWHTLTGGYEGTAETYDRDFRQLLDQTLGNLPDLKLIIGEPFAVKGGSAITAEWMPEFTRYQQSARKIAEDYKAVFIPYQSLFDDALRLANVEYWCPDGVHPSMAGGHLMKLAWGKAFTNLW